MIAKTDYVLDTHNTFSVLFDYSNTTLVEEDTLPLNSIWLSGTSPVTKLIGGNWVWNAQLAVGEQPALQLQQLQRNHRSLDSNVNPSAYGFTNDNITDPRLQGMPRINFSTDDFPSGSYLGGNSSWPLQTSPSATYNLSDTVSRTSGKHSFRFGGDFRYGDVQYYRAGYRPWPHRLPRAARLHGWRRTALALADGRSEARREPEIVRPFRAGRLPHHPAPYPEHGLALGCDQADLRFAKPPRQLRSEHRRRASRQRY